MPHLYIGLMTGTSLDGIDVALVDFSGPRPSIVATYGEPFSAELRTLLLDLQTQAPDELHRAHMAANAHSLACAHAVLRLLAIQEIEPYEIAAIGNHGQTIRHRPECGYTVQIGNHALLAEKTGIQVVGDFRSRDIAAGGQGAPLVPAFHQAMFAHPDENRALINIGGIANLTLLPQQGPVTGFDSGPGNVLIDMWTERHLGQRYDANGAWAATGKVIPELLQKMLSEPFFSLPPPKSTGRDLFHWPWLEQILAGQTYATADVAATLTRLTACSIAQAMQSFTPQVAYLCGGGAHNQTLRHFLEIELPYCRMATTAELGVDPDWVEAFAFAWLAERCLQRQPGNLPAVTGATGQRILGAIWPA